MSPAASASDYFLPRMERLRYLEELKTILGILNANGRSAYVFFRKCSYPSRQVRELMAAGNHVYGLHLENSRTAGHVSRRTPVARA